MIEILNPYYNFNIEEQIHIIENLMLTTELLYAPECCTEINMKNIIGRHDRSFVIQRHLINHK